MTADDVSICLSGRPGVSLGNVARGATSHLRMLLARCTICLRRNCRRGENHQSHDHEERTRLGECERSVNCENRREIPQLIVGQEWNAAYQQRVSDDDQSDGRCSESRGERDGCPCAEEAGMGDGEESEDRRRAEPGESALRWVIETHRIVSEASIERVQGASYGHEDENGRNVYQRPSVPA